MSEDAELLRVLAGLRAQYLAEAPARLADLRSTLARAATGDAPALGELRQLLHRLAGSGGSYGLHEVTEAARAGELAIYQIQQREKPPTDADVRLLSSLVERVATAFRDAGAST
jgi:chemotaxis protein histidine kinase CheA